MKNVVVASQYCLRCASRIVTCSKYIALGPGSSSYPKPDSLPLRRSCRHEGCATSRLFSSATFRILASKPALEPLSKKKTVQMEEFPRERIRWVDGTGGMGRISLILPIIQQEFVHHCTYRSWQIYTGRSLASGTASPS